MKNRLLILFLAIGCMQNASAMDVPSAQIQLTKELFVAIQENNLEQVRNCLAQGADVHAEAVMSNHGFAAENHTVLTWAAKNGNQEISALLLEAKADVTARCRMLPHTHPIKIRTKYNASAPSFYTGFNALDCAACNGNEALCQLFIKAGADVNAQGLRGMTPLMWAAQYGHSEVCAMFLEQGASVSLRNDEGHTALVRAAFYGGNKEACRVLIESSVGNEDFQEQLTQALLVGAQYPEIAKLLVLKRANVNARDSKEDTPLMIAANNGNTSLCGFLIDHGADVNAKDRVGRAVIRRAMHNPCIEICQVLIDRKADVNTRDTVGNSPLMLASDSKFEVLGDRSYALGRLLIQACANVHVKNHIGWNALMWAARESFQNTLCELLVEEHRKYDQCKKALLISMRRLKVMGKDVGNVLYRNFKTVLLPHFLYPSLRAVLKQQYDGGNTPYDYCKIDCLNAALLHQPVVPFLSEVSEMAAVVRQDDLLLPALPSEGSSSWCPVQ